MGNCKRCGASAGFGNNVCTTCWKEELKEQAGEGIASPVCSECACSLGKGPDSCQPCSRHNIMQLKYRYENYANLRILEDYQKGEGELGSVWDIVKFEFEKRKLRLKPWKDQEHIILTTAPFVDGYKVVNTIGIVSAECVQGMNIIQDFVANISDIVGGRSGVTQNALREARELCLKELRKEADALCADAVIAVDLDYSEFSGQGKSMLFLVANGTAVQLENK